MLLFIFMCFFLFIMYIYKHIIRISYIEPIRIAIHARWFSVCCRRSAPPKLRISRVPAKLRQTIAENIRILYECDALPLPLPKHTQYTYT